jgi:hypothetical protein
MAFPSRYTAEIAERMLAELRRGRGLRDVCSDAGMPSARTVHKWVNDDHQGFAAEYRRARETGRAALGRAPPCTPERAARILRELSKGRTLIGICRDAGMPAYATVRNWVSHDRHGFTAPYRKALRAGGARWARPTRYAADIADCILDELCDGRTLEAVCGDPGMPTPTAVRLWVKQDRDGFATRYQTARWIGCDTLGDQMISIADGRDDWITRRGADGATETILDPDRIRRRWLQVKVRYWQLSRMLRHVDGDRFAKREPGSTE